MVNIAHTRGIFFGGIILTMFGGFWSIIALSFLHPRPKWGIPAAAAVTAILVLLCIQRLWSIRGIPSANDPVATAKGKRAGKWFGIIFGIEGALIGLSCALLGNHGLDDWIPIAIALIVAVHFFPLAKLFEVPLYYWLGALSTLGVLACLLIGDPATRAICVGFLMAGLLWLTVSYLLARVRVAG
jgi:hypothetical protein